MRNRFDQFAKLVTREAYAPCGVVETDAEVSPEARRIDLWFTPSPVLRRSMLDHLGMLGRIGHAALTMEAFHQTPDGGEIMDCVAKHHFFRCMLARRDEPPPMPTQWLFSSGRPSTGITGLRFHKSRRWGTGVYHGPALTHTNLLVIRELPETRDTLLLRLMGAGRTLRRATVELDALPVDAPERRVAWPILLRLRFEIPADPAKRTKDDEEFVMTTQDIVEKYLAEREELGHHKGLVESVLSVYRARFGQPPRTIMAAIEGMQDLDELRAWLNLVATRSADEIAAALGAPRAGRASRRRSSSKKG